MLSKLCFYLCISPSVIYVHVHVLQLLPYSCIL